MRKRLTLATLAMLTACGATGDRPWDENRDGLITACEGLNPHTCDATAGCEPVATAGAGSAATLAVGPRNTDRRAHTESCRPTPPVPLFDCGQLSLSACVNDSRCALAQLVSTGGTPNTGGAEFAPVAPDDRRPNGFFCVNRPPSSCEALSVDQCLAHSGCALADSARDVCNGQDDCAEIAIVAPRCITLPLPDFCEQRDPNVCGIDGRCVLESTPLCDVVCTGLDCPPCATPGQRCVAPTPPDFCGARDLNTCAFDGRCVVEGVPVCDVICEDPSGPCPPCSVQTSQFCVPVQPPDLCAGRDLSSCESDGQCALESWACPAVCIDDGDGGCRPCDAPPAACVPVVPPLPVDGSCRDRNPFACDSDPRCQLELVCAAVCIDDGDGGCAPCPATCVARASCDGLDPTSCEAAGCQATFFACTAECRDDGHGGCLPCDSGFVCSGGSSVGASDGGSAP